LCSLIQIAELLSKFHFVLHIYQAALSKLVSKFRLKRSTLPQRYKNFVTLHPSKQKLQLKKVGVTARILSSAAYSDSPLPVTLPTQTVTSPHVIYSDFSLPVTLPTQTVHFLSPYLLRLFTSCHFAYSDSPLPLTLSTQTFHFLSLCLLRQSTSRHHTYFSFQALSLPRLQPNFSRR